MPRNNLTDTESGPSQRQIDQARIRREQVAASARLRMRNAMLRLASQLRKVDTGAQELANLLRRIGTDAEFRVLVMRRMRNLWYIRLFCLAIGLAFSVEFLMIAPEPSASIQKYFGLNPVNLGAAAVPVRLAIQFAASLLFTGIFGVLPSLLYTVAHEKQALQLATIETPPEELRRLHISLWGKRLLYWSVIPLAAVMLWWMHQSYIVPANEERSKIVELARLAKEARNVSFNAPAPGNEEKTEGEPRKSAGANLFQIGCFLFLIAIAIAHAIPVSWREDYGDASGFNPRSGGKRLTRLVEERRGLAESMREALHRSRANEELYAGVLEQDDVARLNRALGRGGEGQEPPEATSVVGQHFTPTPKGPPPFAAAAPQEAENATSEIPIM